MQRVGRGEISLLYQKKQSKGEKVIQKKDSPQSLKMEATNEDGGKEKYYI